MTSPNIARIAHRYLIYKNDEVTSRRILEAGFEGESFDDLLKLSRFMARMVSSMDPASVSYGTYAASGFSGNAEPWVRDLKKALLLAYRRNLIEWMKFALRKRANMGGGGKGIKTVEKGLAAFIEAIPHILAGTKEAELSQYLPDTQYFIADRLNPVGNKILRVVAAEAKAAGVLASQGRTAKQQPFTIRWDAVKKLWYIPFDHNTFRLYDVLAMYGFSADKKRRQWELRGKRLPPSVSRDFTVIEPEGTARKPRRTPTPKPGLTPSPDAKAPTDIKAWFFDVWLPANIDRFTKVFTQYASSKQSSYQIFFSVSGEKVAVKFKRDINTAAKAIEELRYRYTKRQGREAWLEVMDQFIKLVGHTSADNNLMLIIDRMNNLQHSNGLFMEQFPPKVKSWYLKFLNAKYNSPTIGQLAKFIPDKDLKNLLLELSHYLYEKDFRGPGFQQAPAKGEYQTEGKNLPPPEVNWRERGYPRQPGTRQIRREDPNVQRGLETLRRYDVGRINPEFVPEAKAMKSQTDVLKEQAQRSLNVATNHTRSLDRAGVPKDQIGQLVAPLEIWGKEFQALAKQEPGFPVHAGASERYDQWLEQMERKNKERETLEKSIETARNEALQKKEQARKEREEYWRETRMAQRLAAINQVANRYLNS